jgi:hypothetical protein
MGLEAVVWPRPPAQFIPAHARMMTDEAREVGKSMAERIGECHTF